jgi:type II secretory pathway component GspD/PulD (secretin)
VLVAGSAACAQEKKDPKDDSPDKAKERAAQQAVQNLIGTSAPGASRGAQPGVKAPNPSAVPGGPNAGNAGGARPVRPVQNSQGNPAAVPVGGVVQPAGVQQPGVQPGMVPGAQPGDAGAADGEPPADISTDDPDYITLSAFSDPIDLSVLVELVAKTLEINIVVKGELTGTVVFNAPVRILKTRLKDLLDALLEQHGYALTYDPASTFFAVVPSGDVAMLAGDERATQRVFSTPNIRPSSLKPAIDAQLGMAPVGQSGQPGRQIAYIDELGMIIATDTPRRLAVLDRMLTTIQAEFAKAEYIRLPLKNVSAPVARERALQLIGEIAQRTNVGQPGVDPNQFNPALRGQAGGSTGSLDNLGDRLTIDPQGNALIFRGLPAEIDQLQKLMSVIDVRNTLQPRQYFVGSAAQQVADLARQQGLGEVTTIAAQQQFGFGNQFGGFNNFNPQFPQQGLRQQTSVGGPVMVVDESRGTIVYYGTEEQHGILQELIIALNIQSEKVVIKAYKLKHNKAEDVAEVILGILNNQTPRGEGGLLPDGTPAPGGSSGFFGNQFGNQNLQGLNGTNFAQPGGTSGGEDGLQLDSRAFAIADTKNNQVFIKAQLGQQEDFKRLIEKLDLRRPQVYVEAKIVAVTADDRLRLAFETQLTNANGAGGVLNTNFGLGSFADGDQPLLTPKSVTPSLSGFTAAVIRSDYVPFVMRALGNETDSRIIASPQLLVDDNEEAEVTSVDSQPVPTRIVRDSGGSGNNNDVVTSDREVEAGTTLKVTPQISEGGYLRLKYEIELSSFTGEGTADLPPPRQVNTISSESVTVPHDSTVVVGGLVVNTKTKSVAKVPLLGDIPLFGLLFQDRSTGSRQTVLYIFLTPKILRDPNFLDAYLLTKGPQSRVELDPDIPVMMPTTVEIMTPEELESKYGPILREDESGGLNEIPARPAESESR